MSSNPPVSPLELLHTPLHEWHIRSGARCGPFAGYDMPIRYTPGTIAEHHHARSHAGLFDVSHMGVAEFAAPGGGFETVAAAVERLVPCDVAGLAPGRQRYTQLLNDDGGIVDDLMISRTAQSPDVLTVVSNAGRKAVVFARLEEQLPLAVRLIRRPEVALIALQGPEAEGVLRRLTPTPAAITGMVFMDVAPVRLAGVDVIVSRSGYTGDDGFELAVAAGDALAMAEALTAHEEVQPAGLGARDTLRLEAGLCLYGADLDETTSPIEAGLVWSIQKRRRVSLDFPGGARIGHELVHGPSRRLVGLAATGRAPVREHAALYAGADASVTVGTVTSGGFSPTLARPIAMGYVSTPTAVVGTVLSADVRGTRHEVSVVATPFVAHRYRR